MSRPDTLFDELAEYYDFLAAHPPFDGLDPEVLAELVRSLEVRYFRSGTSIFEAGASIDHLYVVRKGAVEVRGEDGALIAREGEGEMFGFPALLSGGIARREARCVEDTLVYTLPGEQFDALTQSHPRFARFFELAHEQRLRSGVQEDEGSTGLLAQPVRALVHRAPEFVPPDASVQAAAERMTAVRISSILVGTEGRMEGIVTDRDLRSRVLAAGLPGETAVEAVMTRSPVAIDADARALEALLTMTRHRIHHLPVLEGETVMGVVSATDLLRVQAAHPVFIVGEIHKQADPAGLASVCARLPGVVQRLARADVRAEEVGRVVSFVADAITERLVRLAEAEMGKAPCRFAFVGLGSQARGELGMGSDQDNALVLEAGGEVHDAYFQRLAEFVRDGLAMCGFPPCPGQVMGSNPEWRKPVDVWDGYFQRWIETPDPRALMNASVFFDMRTVVGDDELVRGLRERMLERAKRSELFLACLVRNALEYRPPLGFFRNFVLERGGQEGRALDLKLRGVVPVVGLARIYALSCGSPEISTRDRIRDSAERGGVSRSSAESLLDAHAFIAQVRMRHQTRLLSEDKKPDNFVVPDHLSSFERSHLKDAFRVVESLQTGLEYRFRTGMLG